MWVFSPLIKNSFGIWPSIRTFIYEQIDSMYGKMDENWARGDTLMLVLCDFFVGKTIYSWVVHDIRSGEMIGVGIFYKI